MRRSRPETLGSFLKKRREAIGVTQKEISQRLGYSSPQFISNIERNISIPPIRTIRVLVRIYQIPPRYMVELLMNMQRQMFESALLKNHSSEAKKSRPRKAR